MKKYEIENADMGLFHPFWEDLFLERPFRKEIHTCEKMMRTDIEETDNSYEFKVEVPGCSKSDLNIALENGYLTISANKNTAHQEKDRQGNYLRRERLTSNCSRSFYVGDIDENAIKAGLEHGVLSISVPKEPKATHQKKIEIK